MPAVSLIRHRNVPLLMLASKSELQSTNDDQRADRQQGSKMASKYANLPDIVKLFHHPPDHTHPRVRPKLIIPPACCCAPPCSFPFTQRPRQRLLLSIQQDTAPDVYETPEAPEDQRRRRPDVSLSSRCSSSWRSPSLFFMLIPPLCSLLISMK
jgi:hypothetical protein